VIGAIVSAVALCGSLAGLRGERLVPEAPLTCIGVAMAAARADVPVALAIVTMYAESLGSTTAVGAAGELGPMQCLPSSHADCAGDPVGAGLRVLRDRLEEQGGDWHAAACRYTGDGPRCTRGRGALARHLVSVSGVRP
jgi:soluble lytic murein transglycosylase-like protein